MDELAQKLMDAPEWMKIFILGSSTLVSEDLTTITAGVLVSQGGLAWGTALLGCFLGIFVGDGLLYLVGFVFGKPALNLPILRNLLTEEKVSECGRWFEANGLKVVLLSRFLPGTRLPTYFAAGLLGARAKFFLPAAALATAIWTPLLILASWFFGEQLRDYMIFNEGYRWLVMALGILAVFGSIRFLLKMGDWKFRRRMQSRWRRFSRYEFWPLPVFYFPIAIYNLLLMIRYRRLSLPLISNPGMPLSGYVGESKLDIIQSIQGHEAFVVKTLALSPALEVSNRFNYISAWMVEHHLNYPLILKPDVGERGDGVIKVESDLELRAALINMNQMYQVQEYAPGPYEFGVFYMRLPDRERGAVMGLTGKDFPKIVGDGEATIDDLIYRHPMGVGRFHIYRERFKARLNEVLLPGETLSLVSFGNHCLGTVFQDSSHLVTSSLSNRFDEISRAIPGFFIGRYDVRVRDLQRFVTGEAFTIVELNGAASEPGHVYDIRYNAFFAYKVFFRLYRDLWRIGWLNASKGIEPPSLFELLKAW